MQPKVNYNFEKANFDKIGEMLAIDWECAVNCKNDITTQWTVFYNKYKKRKIYGSLN